MRNGEKNRRASPARFAEIDRMILADAAASLECAGNLHMLCDRIGPRFAGTAGYRHAADFMLGKFQEYALDHAGLESFCFLGWRRGKPGRLVVRSPGSRRIPCHTLPYSLGTGRAGITAALVDIGAGAPADIAARRGDINGRIVMTTARAAHRTTICRRCARLGAAGFILAGTIPGKLLPTGTIADGKASTIPAVGIPHDSAAYLRQLLARHAVVLALATDCDTARDTTWNVIGELTGTERPDELVIMGAHLDSHEIGPGALDNAAGAVQVMEAARLLARHRQHLRRTVRFIGFAAEEIGLLGSHHHARKHAAALRRARFMLNADCPSLADQKGLVFHDHPQAEEYMAGLAKPFGYPVPCRQRFHRHSDHFPFMLKGLPTAGMGGQPAFPGKHHTHTAADTADRIPVTRLRDGAAFAARILLRASSDDRWPDMRRTPAEVKQLLKSWPH